MILRLQYHIAGGKSRASGNFRLLCTPKFSEKPCATCTRLVFSFGNLKMQYSLILSPSKARNCFCFWGIMRFFQKRKIATNFHFQNFFINQRNDENRAISMLGYSAADSTARTVTRFTPLRVQVNSVKSHSSSPASIASVFFPSIRSLCTTS